MAQSVKPHRTVPVRDQIVRGRRHCNDRPRRLSPVMLRSGPRDREKGHTRKPSMPQRHRQI